MTGRSRAIKRRRSAGASFPEKVQAQSQAQSQATASSSPAAIAGIPGTNGPTWRAGRRTMP